MELVDFDDAKIIPTKGYGGRAGRKIAVEYEGVPWLLKFPESTKTFANQATRENRLPSYTTSPLSEHVGSKVYEILGVPVHRTLLGKREGKVVVACKDFTQGRQLVDFAAIKNTVAEDSLESGNSSSSKGELLGDALQVISSAPIFEGIRDQVLERFWTMFVVDALILNNDRNNGNWGLLVDGDAVELCPVFDNGNAFFNKRSPSLMERRLQSEALVSQDIKTSRSFFLDPSGHHIHPLDFIAESRDPNLRAAVLLVADSLSRGGLEEISAMIEGLPDESLGLPVSSGQHRELYARMVERTAREHVLPAAGTRREETPHEEMERLRPLSSRGRGEGATPPRHPRHC